MVQDRRPGEMEEKIKQAMMKSFEFGDHTPIGVFYQNERIPTYEERLGARMPTYKVDPPAEQEIARKDGTSLANISKLLDELRVN